MDLDQNEGTSSGDPLTGTQEESQGLNGASSNANPSHSQASSGISIVHVTLPQAQVQSVIQPTSVIQSTPSLQTTSLSKGNIILVSKPNSVIHTTGGGAIQTLQVIDGGGIHEDENTKKRREILARRPSYRKILNELGGCEISEDKGDSPGGVDSDDSSSSPAPPSAVQRSLGGAAYQSAAGLLKAVIPTGAIQLATAGGSQGVVGGDGQTISALAMTNTPGGGAVVQYATQGQDGQFFVPVCLTGDLQAYALRPVTTTAGLNSSVVVGTGTASGPGLQNSQHLDDRARKRDIQIMKGKSECSSGNHSDEWDPSEPTLQKRELRLLKNREAARECRRKKKEYIKCLENRVAVLENQNKALIEELKSLKELYCSQKSD